MFDMKNQERLLSKLEMYPDVYKIVDEHVEYQRKAAAELVKAGFNLSL